VGQPHPAQVFQRRAVQIAAERQLHRADADEGGGGDVSDADVFVSVLVNERDRAAQRGRVAGALWSRPFGSDVRSMFARMSRNTPVAGGSTRHRLSRFAVQPGTS
jgi:hypothetical protein